MHFYLFLNNDHVIASPEIGGEMFQTNLFPEILKSWQTKSSRFFMVLNAII